VRQGGREERERQCKHQSGGAEERARKREGRGGGRGERAVKDDVRDHCIATADSVEDPERFLGRRNAGGGAVRAVFMDDV